MHLLTDEALHNALKPFRYDDGMLDMDEEEQLVMARAIEAAVVQSLLAQEPLAWMHISAKHQIKTLAAAPLAVNAQSLIEHGWIPLITKPGHDVPLSPERAFHRREAMNAFAYNSTLTIDVCADASDATRKGYLYRPPVFKGLRIDKVVVVRNGTMTGLPTVDLVLEDEHGQKYVTMTTGRLLRSIPGVPDSVDVKAALFDLAVARGILTLHSERMVDNDPDTRCSWMSGHDKSCDIGNEPYDVIKGETK